MGRKIIAVLLFCFCYCSAIQFCSAADTFNPVTCHYSFDSFDFLSDDFIHSTGKQQIENRELTLIEGRYGKALRHGATRGGEDSVSTSGNDLDLITAVIIDNFFGEFKNIRFREPCFFGTGKINPALGAVAFWVKCPVKPGVLFEQTSISWGRTEKQLIEISLETDGSLNCYVEDARYVQHSIRSGPIFKSGQWNHVVFMWDRSSGLELWLNGEKAAASMSKDAWWANQHVGLFHCAMSHAVYDEFYSFCRPLTEREITALYRKNEPPVPGEADLTIDSHSARRLKQAFSTDMSKLPSVGPDSAKTLVFHDITPLRVHDEGVTGWWVADGRYECAWPHEYTIFTVIPGDVDFHAEKVQILPPKGMNINYVTFEGNLDGISMYAGEEPALDVPETDGFFYGAFAGNLGDAELTIPFTKEYGVPDYFESDVLQLPLSGDLRLHEAGIFNVASKVVAPAPGDRKLFVSNKPPALNGKRYPVALRSLLSIRDRDCAGLYAGKSGCEEPIIGLPPMTILNLMSEPSVSKYAFGHLLFDLQVCSPIDDNAIVVRLRDPAVPSRIWTHAEMRLTGFSGERGEQLRFALRFDPVFLAPGDRVWIELFATDGLSIIPGESSVTLRPVIDLISAEPVYSLKAMRPNILNWGRMFEFIPWDKGMSMPDVDAPSHFGGPFDTSYPWQAVLKVIPGDRIANIYKAFGNGEYERGRHPADLSTVEPRHFTAPENAPGWAVYFREFQTFRNRILAWWRHHQRSDGQVGGGWNDDTLIFGWRYSYGDMPLDSNPDALALYNNSFDGFEKTNYFKDGYCRVWPIDQLHNGDFVRNRCKSLIYNLGDLRSALWAMEEAWHWEKPEMTPVNYGDGSAFLFGKNVLEWYWNTRCVEEPYILENEDREALISQLRTAAFVHNDTTFWRYTEAWCHTDDQYPLGGTIMFDVLCGGLGRIYTRYSQNPLGDDTMASFSIGVGWIEGGGPELARLVTYSGNDGLTIEMYSFDSFERAVVARLFRTDNGEYRVKLRADRDGDGEYESIVFEREQHIKRFDRLRFTVPPRIPVKLDIQQTNRDPETPGLPDLTTLPRYIRKDDGSLVVTVYNIGNAPSGPFSLKILSPEGHVLATAEAESIPGSQDFVPKKAEIKIPDIPDYKHYGIVIDSGNIVREILEENNMVDY